MEAPDAVVARCKADKAAFPKLRYLVPSDAVVDHRKHGLLPRGLRPLVITVRVLANDVLELQKAVVVTPIKHTGGPMLLAGSKSDLHLHRFAYGLLPPMKHRAQLHLDGAIAVQLIGKPPALVGCDVVEGFTSHPMYFPAQVLFQIENGVKYGVVFCGGYELPPDAIAHFPN